MKARREQLASKINATHQLIILYPKNKQDFSTVSFSKITHSESVAIVLLPPSAATFSAFAVQTFAYRLDHKEKRYFFDY